RRAQRGEYSVALLAQFVAAGLPGVGDRQQHLTPARKPAARLRWAVGSGVERDLLGSQERVQRPAAVAGHRLASLHAQRVDVGALLAVDLDAHEVLVHELSDLRLLEGLALHNVAPVAGRGPDRNEPRNVALPSGGERLLAPRLPVDGVVLVLEQIGRGLTREAVGHLSSVPSGKANTLWTSPRREESGCPPPAR